VREMPAVASENTDAESIALNDHAGHVIKGNREDDQGHQDAGRLAKLVRVVAGIR
jgi:hypothetical protein